MNLADKMVNISSNLPELRELLRETLTLAEQLQEKLQQIDEFNFKTEVSKP